MERVLVHDLISVKDAATRKGVSKRAVYRRIHAGLMPCLKIGSLHMVYRSDLDAWQIQDRSGRRRTAA